MNTIFVAPDWRRISRAEQLRIIESYTGPLAHAANTRGGELGHCPCPFCGGEDRFYVQPEYGDRLRWFCRQCTPKGGDVLDFLKGVGMSYQDQLATLGINPVVPAPNGNGYNNGKDKSRQRETRAFPYREVDGSVPYEIVRFDDPKEYMPRDSDGWKGVFDRHRRLLYNLPAILSADPEDIILLVEGEKTAEAFRSSAYIPTTIPGGAKGPWQPQFTEWLSERQIVILRDQDKGGHAYGERIARELDGKAASVKVIDLPDLTYRDSHGDDPENWRERGGTDRELGKLIRSTPDWTALALPAESLTASGLSLPWLTTDQVKAMPPIEYLIPDILPKRSLSMLYGPSGAGKSFVALDWAARLACEGRIVLYVCTEGQAGIGKRIAAWEQHNSQTIPPSSLLQLHQAPNLLDDEQFIALLNDAAILKPDVIILDTLTNMLSAAGADGDKSHDAGRYLTALNRFQQETGAAVLLVHHPTKDGRWERGSGVLRAACDAIIELTNADGLITVSCSKSKDSAPFADKHYQLIPVESADSCVLIPSDKIAWDSASRLTPGEQRVLDVLSWETFIDVGCKAALLASEARIHEKSIYRVLRTLMKRSLVSQDKKGEPYRLTEAGKLVACGSHESSVLLVEQ